MFVPPLPKYTAASRRAGGWWGGGGGGGLDSNCTSLFYPTAKAEAGWCRVWAHILHAMFVLPGHLARADINAD